MLKGGKIIMSKEMFLRTEEAKICLSCNSLEMLDICVSLKDFGEGKDHKLSADVFSYTDGDEIDMHCSKCKSKNTVLIDTKIAIIRACICNKNIQIAWHVHFMFLTK